MDFKRLFHRIVRKIEMIQKNIAYYLKEIIKLTTPIVGIRVFYIAIGFIGMLLIAQLGNAELAAGALVTALSNTIMVIAMSPLLAISIIVSHYHGEGKTTEIGVVLRQAWLISIVMGIIGALLFWNFPYLLGYLDQPPELIPLVRAYFHGLAWGVIPNFLVASCFQIFFTMRKGNLVALWSMLNLLFTILLGSALIFGYVGLPSLGIAGWSYGVSIINWIMLVWIVLYLYGSQEFKRFQIFNFKNKFDYSQLKMFFKISFPITMQFSSELLAFSALNIMVGWLGTEALSVQQIIIQCSLAAIIVPMGIGQACSILIGHAIGRNEKYSVRYICFVSIALAVACMGAVASVYLMTPLAIISLYLNETQESLIHLATIMLSIIAFSQIADAVRNVAISALRGMHDVWYPMWINFILLWGFALPCAYLMAFPFKQGLIGINIGFLIAFFLGALLMMRRFYYKTINYSTDFPATNFSIANN